MLSLLATIVLILLLIQTDPIQNWILNKVTKRLSHDLKTEISIDHISLSFFNSLNLDGTLVRDQQKDTLLYANQLRVRVTDWFFMKDELVIKYLALEDANIYLHRKDSIWNYQFLVNYFSGERKSTQPKKQLKFNLKKLDFKNVIFKQNDEWIGQQSVVKAKSLQLEANNIDLERSLVDIQQLELENPVFSSMFFPGLKKAVNIPKKEDSTKNMYFNTGHLHISIAKLLIKNGWYQNMANNRIAPKGVFDASHLSIEKITGTILNFSFIEDTIKATLDISAKERSGFVLKRLKTKFKLSPQVMEFADLDLLTPRSHLQKYYAMHFSDLNKDFGNYVEKVLMDARLSSAIIDSDDIGYFAPEAKSWKNKILISGNGHGTVTRLSIKQLFASIGNHTFLSGDLNVTGLPDINNTVFDLQKGNFQTHYSDVAHFIPSVSQVEIPSLSSLGEVKFNGYFNGTINKFTSNGNFSTNLGGFSADISMDIPANTAPVYEAKLITRQFDMGRFLAIKDLSTVSFDGAIKGVGLTLNTLKTTVNGKISDLVFKDYAYNLLNVEGTFQRKQFDGTVKIDDENLNAFTTVKIDFTNQYPRFNVLGDLANSNFQRLNLYNKRLEISGLFDLDFSGNNIDQFNGSAKVFNTNILHDTVKIQLDSISIQSGFEEGRRLLTFKSNEFDAAFEGRYNILDLPNAFKLFLHNYYPSYIKSPGYLVKDQELNFIVNTKNIDGYTHLFSKDLTGFSNSSVSGTINTIDTIFEVNADVPDLSFRKTRFSNISLAGRGNLSQLQLSGTIENIHVSDSTHFPNTRIEIVSKKDESLISIKTKANNTLNELNLNATLFTYTDGVRINFNPSDFVINDKRWILEKEGEIVVRKNFVSAENVRFTQSLQHIDVQTTYDEVSNKSNLVVKLQSVNLNDFSPFIVGKDSQIEGVVSGEANMKDFFGKFKIETDLKVEYFRFDNDSIGLVNILGDYNSTNKKINFSINSENELYKFLGSGTYNMADSSGAPLTTNIRLNNTKVKILNKFLNNIFTDIDGQATGNLKINGNPNKPDLLGKVTLYNASMTVNFTQVKYFVDSATFAFHEGYFDFGSFTIKDKFGNTGLVKGKLYQRQLTDLKFNIDISTSKMLLIDTKATDNSQFYGNAIGKATMKITGPQKDLRILITGEPVDSSHIYIPTNATKESADADYIVFRQYGTEMKSNKIQSATNVTVDLDLTANPLAKIDVILDPLTGDIIKAIGNGRLKIHAGTVDNLTMNGRYEIQSGSYDFNFQSFIKKPFILKENANSFIEWSGDPYNARMSISALYIANRVRLGDLVGSQNLGGSVQGYQGDVYVIADLNGKLAKPDINFRIDFPAGSVVKSDETFNQFLSKLERDENEMLKQVTYLIVFGSFAPYGEGRKLQANLTTLGYNTLSDLISKQVNNVVSNLLYKITGDHSLQFDVSTSFYSSSNLFSGNITATNAIDRQKVNFKIGKSLLNNKVVVTFGGDLDFRSLGGNSTSSQQLGNLQWLPDLTVEVILSQDRKIRAIIFSRNNLDITAGAVGRLSRQGASLSYRKDFQGFKVTNKNKKKDANTKPAPPAILTKNDDEP